MSTERQQASARGQAAATSPRQAAGYPDGDPTPGVSVAPWQEQVASTGEDLDDARLWFRWYLAPAYEAHLVRLIAAEVVRVLRGEK